MCGSLFRQNLILFVCRQQGKEDYAEDGWEHISSCFLLVFSHQDEMHEWIFSRNKKQNYRNTHILHMSTVFLSIRVPLFCAVSWDYSCGYISKTARFNNHYSTLKNINSVYKLECITHYFSSILKICDVYIW